MSSVKWIILNLKGSAGAFRQLIKQLQLCCSKTFSCLQERNPSSLLLSEPFPVNLQQRKIFTHTFEHVYSNVGFCFYWISVTRLMSPSADRWRWPLTRHSSCRQTVKCVFSCVQSLHLFLFLLMVWFVSYLFSLSTGSYLNCELTFADGYTTRILSKYYCHPSICPQLQSVRVCVYALLFVIKYLKAIKQCQDRIKQHVNGFCIFVQP